MKKFGNRLIAGVFIFVLAAAMLFNAAEIGLVINDEPVVIEALGSDGDPAPYVPPAPVTPSKKANPIKVKGNTVKINYKKLRNKSQKVSRKSAIKVSNAKGTVRYKKKSCNTKKISINKKGVITVKKGLKAGTYKLKVTVKAYGNSSYKSASRTATVTIKVITAQNPIVVSGNDVTISGDELASADKVISRKEAIEVKNAKGAVTYKMVSGAAMISVSSKGVITVQSGLAPGTYTVKIKVTAAGNKNYKKGSETAEVDIIVSDTTAVDGTSSDGIPAQ